MRWEAIVSLVLIAGCVGQETAEPKAEAAVDAAATASDAPPTPDAAEATAPQAPATAVKVLLDGNLGTTAIGCAGDPVGDCMYVPVTASESSLVLDGLRGTIAAGKVTLTWTAVSPATEQLSAGFMLMDGGDACESIELGSATGASPLEIEIDAASRPLCANEVVHLWVAGTTWGSQGPAYYQVDVDQEFHAEGSFDLLPQ